MERALMEPVDEEWRATVRTYIQREALPYAEKWETARLLDRSA